MGPQTIEYQAGDRTFSGYLADGSGGRRVPGILLAHEGGGLAGHTRDRALRLAELGYVAFAMDLFGETNPGLERAKALVQALRADTAALRTRTQAALAVLRARPGVDPGRLAAIGFCFGGTAVLELARSGAALAGLVGFHAGLTPGTPEDNRAIRARVLMCLGAADPVVPAAQREAFAAAMGEAGVDWQIHLYGGVGHSFTNRESDAWKLPGFAYDARADRRSWQAMRNFLDEVLGRVGA